MYVAGIDIGGTFTDCALIDDDGGITVAKVSTTPDDFSRGFFEVLEAAAGQVDSTLEELLAETELIAHGTTLATNVMAQRRGAKVGLLTTAGHRDVLAMMRASGRVAGLPPDELMHYSAADKPDPIIPSDLIREIQERVDCHGAVVVELDEDQARAAIAELVEDGVEALAVSLLWSFANPVHEKRLRELAAEVAPDVFVTTSHELVPRLGEYERTMAVAVNSYVAPASREYLKTIGTRAGELGFERPILLMECSGGVTPADRAADSPVRLIGSGPAGGIIGAQYLGSRIGATDIIATDMGGTTFDVALIVDSEPVRSATTVIDQCEYFVPTLDIRSIGAGGGSIAWYDEISKTIKVGPESAGAVPGPVAYGRGGTRPTVTDADLVLGYINPESFLDGQIQLRAEAAHEALAGLGEQLGASAMEAAAGVVQIVDFQMADLIRKMTVEKGHDPRSLSVFAYGGGGPLHGAVYGRELGARELIIPLGHTASVWSALGVASSDVLYVYEHSGTLYAPWEAEEIESRFAGLEARAREDLERSGFSGEDVAMQRVADVRYQLQVHNVEVPLPPGPMTQEAADRIATDFEDRYERIFGKGTGYSAAGFEISTLRLRAIGRTIQPEITELPSVTERAADESLRKPSREVWWHELSAPRETPIYDGTKLEAGHVVEGPAVIELTETTVVVRPEQTARLDAFKNITIEL